MVEPKLDTRQPDCRQTLFADLLERIQTLLEALESNLHGTVVGFLHLLHLLHYTTSWSASCTRLRARSLRQVEPLPNRTRLPQESSSVPFIGRSWRTS